MNGAVGPRATTRNRWTLASLVAVAALGVALVAVGLRDAAWHLLSGGAMFGLIALAGVLQHLAERPGRDGETQSPGERASWQQLGAGLVAILMLVGLSLGQAQGVFSGYLFFAAWVLVILGWPLMRRRSIEAALRHRDVPEDERDLALRAQADRLSRRLLELGLVVIAIAWMLAPEVVRAPLEPLRAASLLLLPILVANVAGEARTAWLYWRDRQ